MGSPELRDIHVLSAWEPQLGHLFAMCSCADMARKNFLCEEQ